MAILQVEDIQKRFGRTRVLEDISFSLEQGQAMAIIGSSGSGKTTLLRCLNFLEQPCPCSSAALPRRSRTRTPSTAAIWPSPWTSAWPPPTRR